MKFKQKFANAHHLSAWERHVFHVVFPTYHKLPREHKSRKRMCLGTFSRRGAVASATIYLCAECASLRSAFLFHRTQFPMKQNTLFLHSKKRRHCKQVRRFLPDIDCWLSSDTEKIPAENLGQFVTECNASRNFE